MINYDKEKEFFEIAEIYKSRSYAEFKMECDLMGYSIPKFRNPFTWHHFIEKLKIRTRTFEIVSCISLLLAISSVSAILFMLTKDAWLSTFTFTLLFYAFSKYILFTSDIVYLDAIKRLYLERLEKEQEK